MLHSCIGISIGIGIARGQYYWILDIGCLFGIVLTLILNYVTSDVILFRLFTVTTTKLGLVMVNMHMQSGLLDSYFKEQ